jgi:hypothetical protein
MKSELTYKQEKTDNIYKVGVDRHTLTTINNTSI